MDDGWLLFDGVFLRLPIFLARRRLLLCSVLLFAICGFVALAAMRNSIATLRHYIGGFTAARRRCVLAFSPCFLTSPCSQPPESAACTGSREGSLGVHDAQRGCFGRITRTGRCLLVCYRPLALVPGGPGGHSIGLSTAQRRNGAPLTPSPRRLDVVAKATNAAVRPHKLEGLPESMLSRADVSYSGSHHAHNSADHA